MTQENLIDQRMMYRINRTEREKEKQKKRRLEKIEQTDWLSRLNKGEENSGEQCRNK